MFPIGTPIAGCSAADAVIAISGRLVAIASRIVPPSAAPRCRRSSRTSTVLESLTPAPQMAAAAARKITIKAGSARPDMRASPQPFATVDCMQTLRVHGRNVAYERTGTGPTIVLVHGIAGDSSEWAPVTDRLAAHCDVVTPDLPGHGSSARLRGDHSIGAFA